MARNTFNQILKPGQRQEVEEWRCDPEPKPLLLKCFVDDNKYFNYSRFIKELCRVGLSFNTQVVREDLANLGVYQYYDHYRTVKVFFDEMYMPRGEVVLKEPTLKEYPPSFFLGNKYVTNKDIEVPFYPSGRTPLVISAKENMMRKKLAQGAKMVDVFRSIDYLSWYPSPDFRAYIYQLCLPYVKQHVDKKTLYVNLCLHINMPLQLFDRIIDSAISDGLFYIVDGNMYHNSENSEQVVFHSIICHYDDPPKCGDPVDVVLYEDNIMKCYHIDSWRFVDYDYSYLSRLMKTVRLSRYKTLYS